MAIKKSDLERMNDLLVKGKTIAAIQRKFKNYDYWDISSPKEVPIRRAVRLHWLSNSVPESGSFFGISLFKTYILCSMTPKERGLETQITKVGPGSPAKP